MTVIARNTGSSTENSEKSMNLICDIMSAPTMTSAAAATSDGTIDTSGVKNIATRNSRPVTMFAKPGARALADAGAGLDEDGVRRRRGVAARDGADALDDERGLDAGEVALLVGEAGLFRQARHGAHRVEEVREHEGEDEHERREHADALERAERDLADQRQVGDADERRRAARAPRVPSRRG